jgi:uncharacterized protein YfaS (alpha-2-macroglobulin family)
MGKRAIFDLGLVWVLILILIPISCRKEKKETIPIAGEKAAAGPDGLHILSTSPRGQAASFGETEAVIAIFDRPMVTLDALPEGKGPAVFKFEPARNGKTRWLGSKTLTFTPDERFPCASEIKVMIPRGTRALDGSGLAEDFSWTFQTMSPRLVRHFPEDQQTGLRLDTRILLVFNQPIERGKAASFISLISVGRQKKEKEVALRLTSPDAGLLKEEGLDIPSDFALVLQTREKLEPDSTYFVAVKAGLPGKEGPLVLDRDVVFRFETYRTFRFEGLEKTENFTPDEPLQFRFSNPVSYENLVSRLHFEPSIMIPEYYGEWSHGAERLWLSLPLQPETSYQGWLDAGLLDEFGNALGQRVDFGFSTSSFLPSLAMTSGHGIIEAYEEPRYPISVVNMNSVHIQAARLKKEEIIPLLQQPKIFWASDRFAPAGSFYRLDKTLSLKLARNKRQTIPIELGELLPERFGLIFLQLDSLKAEDKWNRYPKACIQVTELGISGKFSSENNIIWVTELRSGLPVAGAEVEIRDDQNKVKWRGRTDDEGRVDTPGWKTFGLRSKNPYDEPQQWIFAARGADMAFSSSEWGMGIDPYRFRIPYNWLPEPVLVQGAIFTERGIYRTGEDVHIKGIIRKNDQGLWHIPTGREIECEIRDPFEKTVLKRRAVLDDFGSFGIDFTAPLESALGYYQIIAKVPPDTPADKETPLSGSFRVEAFRPAEFEVLLRSSRESVMFGQEYEADIRANYLFGGPMAGQPVTWYLRLNRTSFSPPGHKGYVFGNELYWGDDETEEESRLAASDTAALDSEGKLSLRLPLRADKEKDSVQATLEATVTSPSRRSISSRIQTLVHRGGYYIGLRPSTTFLKKGEGIDFEIIAASPQGNSLAGKKIGLKLVKREWRSARKAGLGGRFHWLTEKEDVEVSSREIVTKQEGASVFFKPEKSGFYFLLASGTDNHDNSITTTTSFYVTGADYIPWERRDDDSIELVPDAGRYRPGETARVLVKSPYEEAKALLTIERESVLESRVLDIRGTASEIAIPIRPEYVPNVFVSLLLVQGRTGGSRPEEIQDFGKPSFKIGYANLSIDPAEKMLSVEISKDRDLYKPKDLVTLKLKVTDHKGGGRRASIAVAVVDAGVLNLIGYQTPDVFSQFYGERSLSVRTAETRLHVVGRREYGEKGEEVGGGAAEGLSAGAPLGLAEVEIRGDFRLTAFWDSSVLTDENGEARVTFTLPDNLTTFRVMAVAQTRESEFGRAETTFRVSKTLLLQAALPRFARVGDIFQGGVVITNLSDRSGSVFLSADASGVHLRDENPARSFPLQAGESREVRFLLEAAEPGLAAFTFRAKMGDTTDGLEVELPLKLPRPMETTALFGETADTVEEKIAIPSVVFSKESLLEIQASSSALLGLKGNLDELTDYPYECLEQRLSAVLPYIVASSVLLDFHLTTLNREEIQRLIERSIRNIYSYQKDSGGFSVWPEAALESPFLTCYAAFTLVKASEGGLVIDKSRLERAALWLKNFLRQEEDVRRSPNDRRTLNTVKAFGLYVLALLKQPEPAYVDKFFAERGDLSLFGKTCLIKALNLGGGSSESRDILLQELLNKAKITPESAYFEDDQGDEGGRIYSTDLRTSALMLQTLIEIRRDDPLMPRLARWLVEKQQAGRRLSTQDRFFAFHALNDYYRKYETAAGNFKARAVLAGRTLLDETFKSTSRRVRSLRINLEEAAAEGNRALPLEIEKTGDGLLYYGARLTYAPRDPLLPRDEGIAIIKKIESLDGKPLDIIAPGSLVVVRLEIALPQETLFIVVDDPLPAGLEAVNSSFATESEEARRRLAEIDRESPSSWQHGFNHRELRDDRVLLFADSLPAGVHTHRYLARALSWGDFLSPGTKAEAMYAPEVFGRSAEMRIRIGKR